MTEQGASTSEQRKLKKARHLRINVFFFIVFVFFVALVLRLGVVQIVYGQDYKREVEKTEDVIVSTPVPRGKIYDRNGQVIVDNVAMNAITYTRFQKTSPKEMIATAKLLAGMIELDEKEAVVKDRDLKDYWIATRTEKAAKKIKKEELADKKLEDKDRYKLQIDRITEKDLKEITDEEMKVAAIFRNMNSGYALTPQVVKKNATQDEYSRVSEHLAVLPNVDITTEWDRAYPHEGIFRSVLGNVTKSDEGLPHENLDHFLSRGYQRNDRVGKSQLEFYYEDVLHGQKAKIKNKTDKGGALLSTEVISEGERGKDLVLSIDLDLQAQVEKTLEEQLRRAKGGNRYLDRAFVVMMEPSTGEVLSMAGKQLVREDGKLVFRDFALGNINTQYEMGSTVKGATILAGLKAGAISRGTVFYDSPLKLSGTKPKGSYKALGNVSIQTALQKSSNIYMFKTVIRMLGREYYSGMSLPRKPEVMQEFRNSFSELGLGVETGIDLPNETKGQQGNYDKAGLFLDLAIGQYDSYTPMQLAQYTSTVANGGYRMKPQLVKEIHDPSNDEETGIVLKPFKPEVLNKVSMDKADIKAVQEGFRYVYQVAGGTAFKYFGGDSRYRGYQAAGKTGTAQSFYKNETMSSSARTYNLTLVGYAPYDKPEVAYAIVVPYLSSDTDPVNKYIGQDILKAYFDLKKQRESGQTDSNDKEEKEQTEETAE
ncbi:peptidoglycan D,D-transpeptidase FtsI family protein [Metabacillus fastidiosus]|uniref:peptidoglycan D,D-transpeptidase FtsI family protein n=1 Tax=Metabacillus fastidiosus TaxID=1458 RepID=UPI000824E6E2|nr:penicillin-binding protein 2 [Metabacillus fastidiosus]MED4463535.1 penicillin-binding protein 2 [Metabacillus fastidiosus]